MLVAFITVDPITFQIGKRESYRLMTMLSAYPRFRFGVGSEYRKGRQVDFVLGKWSAEEESAMIERIPFSVNAVTSFITAGLSNTMNEFNGK